MSERLRVLFLIVIMTAVAIGAVGISLFALYEAAFEEQNERLIDAARSQARMMEAMARFNSRYFSADIPGGGLARTIEEIADAHEHFEGFGKTGEFVLGKREGEEIVFLFKRRLGLKEHPEPVLLASKLAEPMRRALSGKSGTVVGLDYRGEMVFAAYVPVRELDFGLVAKIDLAEIRAPFIRAGLLAGGGALAFVLLGSGLFWRLMNPLMRRLGESEEKYRSIFEGYPNAVFLLTDDFEDCNEQAHRLWACDRKDIIGHSLVDFSLPGQPDGRDSREALKQHIDTAFSGTPQFFHWQNRRKDGIIIDVDVSLKAIEICGRMVLLIIIQDSTKHMKMEEALRESEERFRLIFDSAPAGMAIVTPGGEIQQVNPAHCRLLGFFEQELLKQNVLKFTHPADREKTRQFYAELLAGRRQIIDYEKRYLRKDGVVLWGHTTVSLICDSNKKPLYAVALVQDITERKQAEAALKESEALLSVIYNESTQFMGLMKPDGTLLKINRTAAEFIRTNVSQALNKPFWETPWWTHSPEQQRRLRDAISRAAQGEFVRFETTHPKPEGGLIHVDFSLKPVKDAAGNVVLLVPEGRDITNRKAAEEALRLSEERRLRLQTELDCAAEVQQKLLPRTLPNVPGFEIAARCLPARQVGGDFYDLHEMVPGTVTLTLGDVMGKGMTAAMVMATVRAALRAMGQTESPAAAMQWTEGALSQDLDNSESFVTLFHAQLNLASQNLTYVDCGHGLVFLRRLDGRVEELHPRCLPLGVPSKECYEEGTVVLERGDTLVVYSDGLIDALPELGLGNEALADRLEGASSAMEMVDRLARMVPPDSLRPDDLTVLVVRRIETDNLIPKIHKP